LWWWWWWSKEEVNITKRLHGTGHSLKSPYSDFQRIALCLYGTQRFITVFTKTRHRTILSQPNPVRPIDPYPPKVRLNFPLLRSCQRINPGPKSFERPNPKPYGHPLSAGRDCLSNIFGAALHMWRPCPPFATWGLAMPWWKGTHLTWGEYTCCVNNIVKVKKKLSPCFFISAPRHEGVLGSWGIAPLILWPLHYVAVNGQLHAPPALLPGKEPLVPIG
jgi:hypothetical protein